VGNFVNANQLVRFLVFAFAVATAVDSAAQYNTPSIAEKLSAYSLEYERIQSPDRTVRDIEQLYRRGLSVTDMLLSRQSKGQCLLETLTQDQLNSTRRELPGIFINREEVLEVSPDPEQFFDLALKFGDRADIGFFSILKVSYASPGWPVYIDRLTDYSGCTRLGSFVFSELYEMWRSFQRRFPDRYAGEVRKEVVKLEQALLDTGACEGSAKVVAAYREFLRAFPNAPVAEEIRVRIDAISGEKSELRFESHPH
jgi:hypothetical protein